MATSRGTVRLHQSAVAATSRQAGVVARRQLLAWGWTSQEIQGQVRAGRWRRLHRGVYWTATGPPPREAARWAALLACGEGAVLCGRTAAELWGFGPESVSIFVGVPATLRPRRRMPGVHVRNLSWLARRTHPRFLPPRTTVEDTVLDLLEESKDEATAIGWITAALQARKTTPRKLLAASLTRGQLGRRELLELTCGYYRDGATTPLEIGWVRKVERAHGLPSAQRQVIGRVRGQPVRRDLGYAEFGLFVELDGRLGHEGAENAFRDMDRDNAAAVEGLTTLRYGWTAVMSRPCDTAAQVGAVLASRGWAGRLRRCAPTCLADRR